MSGDAAALSLAEKTGRIAGQGGAARFARNATQDRAGRFRERYGRVGNPSPSNPRPRAPLR